MVMMTVEDYLANGGTITVCPTVYLLPTINAVHLNTGMADRVREDHLRWKNGKGRARGTAAAAKRSRAISVQTERHNARNKATCAERCAALRRAYDAGITPKEISVMNGISVDRVKKLLRETGVSFKGSPRKPRSPSSRPPPVHSHAEIVRLYTVERMSVNAVARAVGCSNITVRRACSLAGVTRIQGRRPYSPLQAQELEARKQQARELRSTGLSFKAIASIMGRNHETIRGYCDDEVAAKRTRNGRIAK